MADNFTRQKRSQIMKAVKSCGNRSTEIKLIQIFKEKGIKGWRRKFNLVGKPDFVFPKKRIAIFADGCFWHGHNCRNISPSDNAKYWKQKIESNIARDKKIIELLSQKNWRVFRIWECEIKKKSLPDELLFILK